MKELGMPSGSTQFEQSPEAAFRLDPAGRLTEVTVGLATLLRLPAEQLRGRHLAELLLPAQELTAALARAAYTVISQDADALVEGQPQRLSVTLLPMPETGGVCGLVRPVLAVSPTNVLLLERERHLSIIFDTIADVLFVLRVEPDEQFRFAFVNKAFERTTGLPAGQVIGRLVTEVIPEPSLSEVLQHYQQALRTQQPVQWLEASTYPSGCRLGEVTVTPVRASDGTPQLIGVVHDLTRQKETEIRLQTSNERFQYALKATTDALYDWNIAADTLYWGEGFEALFGHQLLTNPTAFSKWAEYVDPAEHERVVAGLRHTAFETHNLFWQQEYRFLRADGSWAVVFDRGYILRDAQGQAVRMIGAMQDISARKEAEQQQNLLRDKLVKQNADLQQFTYIVSHNLRAPLANALGYARLLTLVEKSSVVFAESLRNLSTSLDLLDAVLTDVNSILSSRDQQGSFRPEAVNIADVCRQAMQSLAGQLQECGGQLHCSIPEDLSLPGSRAYFHSIFHNLISNAIKYRSDTRPLRIAIQAHVQPDRQVAITVGDNGLGFDQQQGNVFQLYRRFHPEKPGRGIGLFLVKSHVESMNGRISVRSEVNAGTEFTLLF